IDRRAGSPRVINGLEMARMVEYARSVGGPAIRELTFHQRATILKSLTKHLAAQTQDVYAQSAKAGATLGGCEIRRGRGPQRPGRLHPQGPRGPTQRHALRRWQM